MSSPTPITVHVPWHLRDAAGGSSKVSLPPTTGTVRDALVALERSHPAVYRNICDETGAVRRHLSVFVNSSHVRDREGLDTVLAAGDVVSILTAVSGG